MVDIFDEVSGDLRAERAERLLRRYGVLLIGLAVLVLLAVGGQQAWVWYQARLNTQAATQYLAITTPIDDPNAAPLSNDQRLADAKKLVDFASSAPAGYRSMARLRAAGLYADAGQADAAEGQWNTVAADGDADPLLRDVANLLWAQHALGTAPDAAVAARLAPLAASANPFHGLAQETQALMYLHEGKTDQAKALFSQISSDPAAPDGVRNRADGLLAKLNG